MLSTMKIHEKEVAWNEGEGEYQRDRKAKIKDSQAGEKPEPIIEPEVALNPGTDGQ